MTARSIALATAALLAVSGAAHANLLINGGFEEPAFADNSYHYVKLNGTELTGWTSSLTPGPNQGSVLFNALYDRVSEGNQAVQIEDPLDWISQTFATVVNRSYLLTFDLTDYAGFGRQGKSSLGLEVGQTSLTFTGYSGSYVRYSVQFTANALSTTLKFENIGSVDACGCYPEIDSVSVVGVPEPTTYALMLAGLGALGLVARRRRHAAT